MGETVSERRKVWIRKHDYYGGNLFFTMPHDEHDTYAEYYEKDQPLELVWESWGAYGGSRISLQDGDECRMLAAALLEAATILDDDEQDSP